MKKIFSILLVFSMFLTCTIPAYAAYETPAFVEIKDGFIIYNYDNEFEQPYLGSGKARIFSGEVTNTTPVIVQEIIPVSDNTMSPNTFGEGTPIAKIVKTVFGSSGLTEVGYKAGTFSSIASFALSFIPGVASATVSQILSAVSLVASSNSKVYAKTFVSSRNTYREGLARWSSDPNLNSYYSVYYRTGQQETFKHVLGAVWDDEINNYRTGTHDYLDAPIYTERSANYASSDAWLLNATVSNAWTGTFTDETWF